MSRTFPLEKFRIYNEGHTMSFTNALLSWEADAHKISVASKFQSFSWDSDLTLHVDHKSHDNKRMSLSVKCPGWEDDGKFNLMFDGVSSATEFHRLLIELTPVKKGCS
jgi:hypothetical protein